MKKKPDSAAEELLHEAARGGHPEPTAKPPFKTEGKGAVRIRRHAPHPANLALIIRGKESQILTSAEAKTLRDLKTRYDAVAKQLDAVNHDAARNAILAAKRAFDENPTQENLAKLNALGTVENLRATHDKARTSIKDKLRSIAREALPLIETVRARLLPVLEAEVLEAQKAEQQLCDHYGIPYTPGPVSAAVETLVWEFTDQPLFPSNAWSFITRCGLDFQAQSIPPA